MKKSNKKPIVKVAVTFTENEDCQLSKDLNKLLEKQETERKWPNNVPTK